MWSGMAIRAHACSSEKNSENGYSRKVKLPWSAARAWGAWLSVPEGFRTGKKRNEKSKKEKKKGQHLKYNIFSLKLSP